MSAWIEMKFYLEVPERRGGAEDLKIEGTLPFVPQIGMWIVPTADDNFYQVEDVYWSEAGGFEVYLTFDQMSTLKQLKKLGWGIA